MLQADLIAVDTHFTELGISDMNGFLYLKNTLISLANLVDFELTIRMLYKEHRTLSEIYTKNKKYFDFAKYLRNKFVGHIHKDLVEKAIEWKPELRMMAPHMKDQKMMLLTNIFILETAINTYVDDNEKHKVFDSETDLVYPPDWERFLNFLEISVRSAIQYLKELCNVLNEAFDHPDPKHLDLELVKKAAETKFEFLKK